MSESEEIDIQRDLTTLYHAALSIRQIQAQLLIEGASDETRERWRVAGDSAWEEFEKAYERLHAALVPPFDD